MTFRSEIPPPPGNLPVQAPPASDRPTSAMLKADIDSGATGDKVKAHDPGLSQLGTDDEAAGQSPTHARIALARKTEAAPARVRNASRPHGPNAWVVPSYCAVVGGIGIVLGLSLWLI